MARALSMNVFSRMDSATPRTMRDSRRPAAIPSTSVMFSTLGPSSDMMDIRMSRPGNAIQASTRRCSSRSSRPPQ